jgi:phage FluMu protein Com
MYIIRCDTCGFLVESEFVPYTICPHCSSLLIIEHDNEDDEITNHMNDHKSERENHKINMAKELKRSGHEQVYKFIEHMVEPKLRAYWRKIFFEVGGQYPNSKIEA